MQRTSEQSVIVTNCAFSILGRIGGDATYAVFFVGGLVIGSFSILGRIGGDATRRRRLRVPGAVLPFSILGRIGGDATW